MAARHPRFLEEQEPFMGDTPGINYCWKNIRAEVRAGARGCLSRCRGSESGEQPLKLVLDNVSGVAERGDLCAILGASGAGKSSLLNALTLRNVDSLDVSGQRFCNSQEVTPESLTAHSAYVQQDDMFIGTLTVREHLEFQARVRMDGQFSPTQRAERIQEVIRHFGLANCADVLIGVQGRIKGISGGESKRLALASEVLTDPYLMFCDEPTSGLDAYMAFSVVETLKRMADAGRTVILTIHQPSSQIFTLFSKIMLLAEGRVAFHGTRASAETFFNQIDRTVPQYFNPADYYIHQLAVIPDKREQSLQDIADICQAYRYSPVGDKIRRIIDAHSQPNPDGDEPERTPLDYGSKYKVGWFQQFFALLSRTSMATVKEPMIFKVKILSTLFISLVLGFIYYGQKYNQAGIMNINGAIFIIITNLSFDNIFAVVMTFCNELPIFLREHANGMYRTDVYLICKQLVETPVFLLTTTLTVTLIYWMAGLNPDPLRFLGALGIALLVTQVIVSFGYMISCIVPNAQVANDVAPVLILPFMLVGGFFLNNLSIPAWLIWLKYISWFKYANECLIINQWSEVVNITCHVQDDSCIQTGDEVIMRLGYEKDNMVFNLGMMVALSVVYRVIGFIFLFVKSRKRT